MVQTDSVGPSTGGDKSGGAGRSGGPGQGSFADTLNSASKNGQPDQNRTSDTAAGRRSQIDNALKSIESKRFGQDSIHLARAEIRDAPNGTVIDIKPEQDLLQSLPNVTVPNNVGASGFERDMWQHDYLVVKQAPGELNGAKGLEAVEKALINNPTPGASKPATAQGTLNDVGNLAPLDGDDNFVRSFVVPSNNPNRSDIVVNYTVDGQHILEEGFVMRYAEMDKAGRISLVTYGEGDALPQVEALEGLVWGSAVEKVWGDNAALIFDRASASLK